VISKEKEKFIPHKSTGSPYGSNNFTWRILRSVGDGNIISFDNNEEPSS
jgi:hypothetical protein